jgi:hypothetical protein
MPRANQYRFIVPSSLPSGEPWLANAKPLFHFAGTPL